MKLLQEFKAFAVKGNAVDMAVGIIVGAAFGKIVNSLVGDVIMPPIGLAVGGVDFSDLVVTLKSADEGAPAVVLKYGAFLQTVVDFTIIAFAVFLLVKGINALKRTEEAKSAPPSAPSRSEELLVEIRDLLRRQAG